MIAGYARLCIRAAVLAALACAEVATPLHATPQTGAADRHPDRSQPADLSGTWRLEQRQIGFFARTKPVLTVKGQALYAARLRLIAAGRSPDPLLSCFSPGFPRAMWLPLPIQIVQDRTHVVMLFAVSQRARRISTDGRPVDDRMLRDFGPLYNGYATGTWDGQAWTFVTVGLDQAAWIDGSGIPKSAGAKVTERLVRSGDRLTIETTIDDPEMLAQPWKTRKIYTAVRDTAMLRDESCPNLKGENIRWFEKALPSRR